MGYYVRVLGKSDPDIHLNELVSSLADDGLSARLLLRDDESPEKWTVLQVSNSNDQVFMQVERNPVNEGELGKEELDEFREEVQDCLPTSAAEWLEKYFGQIRVIYAFQLFNGSMEDENFSIVTSIRTSIWKKVGGILQADSEGFSNEAGYHILWQFNDDVDGQWNMAVRTMFGGWKAFTMNLGNPDHRKAFKAGKVPTTATSL